MERLPQKSSQLEILLISKIFIERWNTNEEHMKALYNIISATNIPNEGVELSKFEWCLYKKRDQEEWNNRQKYISMYGLSTERNQTLKRHLSNKPINVTKAYGYSVDFQKSIDTYNSHIWATTYGISHVALCIHHLWELSKRHPNRGKRGETKV